MRLRNLLITLSAAIFVGEAVIMFVLDSISLENPVVEGLIDSTALVAIVFPVIYLFAFKTLMMAKEQLEERIAQRTQEIQETNEALEDSVEKLHVHRQMMVQLSEMANFLQACDTVEEATAVAGVYLQQLFPDVSGGLFLMKASRNILERAVVWGPQVEMPDHHAPEECWALRRSKPHVVREAERALACEHMRSIESIWHVCMPLIAHGEVVGTLSLHAVEKAGAATDFGGEKCGEEWLQFYDNAGKNLALAFSNLRLREKLRYQALRDPLTGLFNRRYLLDTFEHELERAIESGLPMSIAMFDIDHFKSFNDTFGHVAGDAVLTQLGMQVREWASKGDVAVRFGGEEFTIIMPDTSPEQAYERLENLRQSIEVFPFEQNRQYLGQVTISLGLATYPVHGKGREALIQLADQALYASKHEGRNRTTAAEALS